MIKSSFLMILIALVLLAVHYFVSVEFYRAAVVKGWAQKKYHYYAFFLWIIGYILIIALPDRGGSNVKAIETDDLPDI